jgi:membrane associated rhomboid family serine protease
MVPQRVLHAVFQAPGQLPLATVPFFTSLFLHGGWLHLLGNMLYLYIFGDNVESVLGHVRYLFFYLGCGVAASITHLLANTTSSAPSIGASGAIAGVLGAYFLMFPRAKIVTLLPIFFFITFIRVPAILFLGLWFFIQFMSGSISYGTSAASSGVAWWAHIGGFAVGVLYTVLRYRSIRERTARMLH